MAADVRSPPKCFPIAADACRALLFPTGNMGGVCNTPLHGCPTMAAVVHSPPKCFPIHAPDAHSPLSETILWADGTHSPPKCFPIAADTCRALLFSAMNIGGVCFCAPTRTSDNGRLRSLAPVGNHFIGHRVPSAGRVGAYCIRLFK